MYTAVTACVLLLSTMMVSGQGIGGGNVPSGIDHAPSPNPGISQALLVLCEHLCVQSAGPCPHECKESYLGSWSMTKRSRGIGGLTFDDYLFMRLMGRDMVGKR